MKADEDCDDRHNDDETSLSTASLNWVKSNDASIYDDLHKAIPICAPEPRVVVHHHFPFFDRSASRHTTSNDPLLKLLRHRKYFDIEKEIMERDARASLASSSEVRCVLFI